MSMFKSFSNKQNAQRKAKQLGVDAVLVNGQWGVYLVTEPTIKQVSPWSALDLDYSQPVKKEIKVPSFKGFGVIPTGEKVKVKKVKAEKKESVRKVQKDRPTRNGITRPSEGTLCGAVWAKMDTETDPPTAKTAQRLAKEHNWNVNNVTIEVYRWKKFHA